MVFGLLFPRCRYFFLILFFFSCLYVVLLLIFSLPVSTPLLLLLLWLVGWSDVHCILISVRYNASLRRSTTIFNHFYGDCVIDLGLSTNEFSSSYLLLLLPSVRSKKESQQNGRKVSRSHHHPIEILVGYERWNRLIFATTIEQNYCYSPLCVNENDG